MQVLIAADRNSSYLYYPQEEEEGIIVQAIEWKPMVSFYLFCSTLAHFGKRIANKSRLVSQQARHNWRTAAVATAG